MNVYILEHVVRYEGSEILGAYTTWEALLYGIEVRYPNHHPDYKTPIPVEGDETNPTQWETTEDAQQTYLRVTLAPAQSQTGPRFQVRVTGTTDGVAYDTVVLDSGGLTDRAHADALAAEWNAQPPFGAGSDARYYVRAF